MQVWSHRGTMSALSGDPLPLGLALTLSQCGLLPWNSVDLLHVKEVISVPAQCRPPPRLISLSQALHSSASAQLLAPRRDPGNIC